MSVTEPGQSGLAWQKASRTVGNGACVEVAPVVGMVAVRDSKNPSGAILFYTPEEWAAFLDGAKKGEFDHLV
jgi:hypothetical protein